MLKIRKDVVDALIAHAGEETPLEACGYLAEKDGTVVALYPLANADASEDHFTMKPEEQFAALRRMRAAGLTLRAAYHSHPSSEARPSEEDVRLAHDPDISYVIVSLLDGLGRVKSFRIREGAVQAEDVETV